MCCRYTSDWLLYVPRTLREVPPVRVFLRDPSPYLREFRKKKIKHGKLWKVRSTSVNGDWTPHLPSTGFQKENSAVSNFTAKNRFIFFFLILLWHINYLFFLLKKFSITLSFQIQIQKSIVMNLFIRIFYNRYIFIKK